MTEDEKAIRLVVNTWLEASKRGDIATVLGLMTDDVVFMVPGRQPFGKEAFAAAADEMRDVRIEGTSEILELQVLGQWGFIRSHIDMTAIQPDGARVRRTGYAMTLLRKEPDGSWKLARDANLLAGV
jgi:uncharacterized protein (TIGR02246 family)